MDIETEKLRDGGLSWGQRTEGLRDRGTEGHRHGEVDGQRDGGTDGQTEGQWQRGWDGVRLCYSCAQLDPNVAITAAHSWILGGGASLPHLGTAGSQRRRDARHTAGSRDRLHIWARLDPGVTTPPAHSWLLGSLPHLGTAGSRYWGGEGEGKGAESSVDPVTLRTIP